MPPKYATRRALILVRTYPVPAKSGVEVSCTAAVDEEGNWLRLFPIPYRFLGQDQRFRKYQWIEVDITKASDARPESFKIRPGSVKIVSGQLPTTNDWKARKEYVLPLRSHCMCCLQRTLETDGKPTLGVFRPKSIKRLVISPAATTWSQSQLEILRQGLLFEEAPTEELEKVPFTFYYEFSCDEADCPGHRLSCTDWEMGQSWRSWRDKYGEEGWEEKFRQTYESDMINRFDTHFYVGTVHRHPRSWIIVGLFYPPAEVHEQTTLQF